jgi:TusA-related sulfurtransferase
MALEADETLDFRGTACLLPVVRTQFALSLMNPGQVLCVVGRGAATERDLEVWARETGTAVVGVEHEEDGTFRMFLQKQ